MREKNGLNQVNIQKRRARSTLVLKVTPKEFLFEGQFSGKYNSNSVQIGERCWLWTGTGKRVTSLVLRHGFASHLLESGTDLKHIQLLLGHNSTKTTEIHTHIATSLFSGIKNPLDS